MTAQSFLAAVSAEFGDEIATACRAELGERQTADEPVPVTALEDLLGRVLEGARRRDLQACPPQDVCFTSYPE